MPPDPPTASKVGLALARRKPRAAGGSLGRSGGRAVGRQVQGGYTPAGREVAMPRILLSLAALLFASCSKGGQLPAPPEIALRAALQAATSCPQLRSAIADQAVIEMRMTLEG